MPRVEVTIDRYNTKELEEYFLNNEDTFAQVLAEEIWIYLKDEHGLERVLNPQAVRDNLEKSSTIGKSEKFDSLVTVEHLTVNNEECIVFTFPTSDKALSILKKRYLEYFDSLVNQGKFVARIVQVPKGFKNLMALEAMSNEVFAKVDEFEAATGQQFVIYSAVDTSLVGPLFNRFTLPFIERLTPKRLDVVLKLCKNREEAVAHATQSI